MSPSVAALPRFESSPTAIARGQGRLVFRRRGERTVLDVATASSPLRFLCPRNHGTFAWAFVSSFGGGLVDGDALAIDLEVGPDAGALLATQASTKVYRSPRFGCSQRLSASVGDGASLVMLPDPLVVFAGGKYVQDACVKLAPSASVLMVDAFTAGRVAHGERWAFDQCRFRTRILRGDRCVAIDAMDLDGSMGSVARRMGRFDAFATVITAGPAMAAIASDLRTDREPLARGRAVVEASSDLGDDGVIFRVAAESVLGLLVTLRRRLARVPELLGDDPFVRKY